MNSALVVLSLAFSAGLAVADAAELTPTAPPGAESTAPTIDATKPTALLVATPQGALMLTPEMVDKIVRAQTPEYLRSIVGTPAPTALGTPSRPAVRISPKDVSPSTKMRAATNERPQAGL
jgi:hypothetical protein